MDLLSEADLAYMRATQDEARPTHADLLRRVQAATASGGRSSAYQEPVPVTLRLDGKPSTVPAAVTAVIQGGKPTKVAMDLVEVRAGDLLRVTASEVYEVVTDMDGDDWITAQIVWTKRVAWEARDYAQVPDGTTSTLEVLTGTGVPPADLDWVVGQLYLDTVSGNLYRRTA